MRSFQSKHSLHYNDNKAKLKCPKFQENHDINIASNVSIKVFCGEWGGIRDYSGNINETQSPLSKNIESNGGCGWINIIISSCHKRYELEKHRMLL